MQVMFYDGATREGPTRLPTSATKRLDGGTISKITTEAEAIACGYYRIELATATAGYVIVSTAWPNEPNGSNVFVQTITEEITQAEWDEQQKEDTRGYITTLMDEPIWRVMKKVIYFLGSQHGFTTDQINAKLTQWIDEEVGL